MADDDALARVRAELDEIRQRLHLPERTEDERRRWDEQEAAYWIAWDEQEARALAGLPWGNVRKNADGTVSVQY